MAIIFTPERGLPNILPTQFDFRSQGQSVLNPIYLKNPMEASSHGYVGTPGFSPSPEYITSTGYVPSSNYPGIAGYVDNSSYLANVVYVESYPMSNQHTGFM